MAEDAALIPPSTSHRLHLGGSNLKPTLSSPQFLLYALQRGGCCIWLCENTNTSIWDEIENRQENLQLLYKGHSLDLCSLQDFRLLLLLAVEC